MLEKELKQLQEACEEVEHDYRPPITFVVVQKHHHTRFFPVHNTDKVRVFVGVRSFSWMDSFLHVSFVHYCIGWKEWQGSSWHNC